MPEMDGLGLIRALREQGYEQPIVVITADIQGGTREEVLNLGATCFINKPITAEDVATALETALKSVKK
ncbi:MAG: response regulator, partial [Planctomycetes bacterium]|nr:response regulator [Planctomycetota bacterium]